MGAALRPATFRVVTNFKYASPRKPLGMQSGGPLEPERALEFIERFMAPGEEKDRRRVHYWTALERKINAFEQSLATGIVGHDVTVTPEQVLEWIDRYMPNGAEKEDRQMYYEKLVRAKRGYQRAAAEEGYVKTGSSSPSTDVLENADGMMDVLEDRWQTVTPPLEDPSCRGRKRSRSTKSNDTDSRRRQRQEMAAPTPQSLPSGLSSRPTSPSPFIIITIFY